MGAETGESFYFNNVNYQNISNKDKKNEIDSKTNSIKTDKLKSYQFLGFGRFCEAWIDRHVTVKKTENRIVNEHTTTERQVYHLMTQLGSGASGSVFLYQRFKEQDVQLSPPTQENVNAELRASGDHGQPPAIKKQGINLKAFKFINYNEKTSKNPTYASNLAKKTQTIYNDCKEATANGTIGIVEPYKFGADFPVAPGRWGHVVVSTLYQEDINKLIDDSDIPLHTPKQALSTFRQQLSGVDSMNKAGYTHGDIKRDNVFIREKGSDLQVRLADYDGALGKKDIQNPNMIAELTITPSWMSPNDLKEIALVIETITRLQKDGNLDPREKQSKIEENNAKIVEIMQASDVFSVCSLLSNYIHNAVEFDGNENLKEELKKIIDKGLVEERSQRPSAADLLSEFETVAKKYEMRAWFRLG